MTKFWAVADYNVISTPLAITSLSPRGRRREARHYPYHQRHGFYDEHLLYINQSFRGGRHVCQLHESHEYAYANDIAIPARSRSPVGTSTAQVAPIRWNHVLRFDRLRRRNSGPSVSPASLTFTSTAGWHDSASKSVTDHSGLVRSPSAPSQPVETSLRRNTCGGSLASDGHCTVTVTFNPSIAGSIGGALTFSDNAASSPQLVKLTAQESLR